MGGAELHYHNPLGAVIPNGKGSLDIARVPFVICYLRLQLNRWQKPFETQ